MTGVRAATVLHSSVLAFAVWHSALATAAAARSVTWADLTPAVRERLQAAGIAADSFAGRLAAIDRDDRGRVQEGDYDHLVFYVLQSAHFTTLPPIEPALSARQYVGRGPDAEAAAARRVPAAVEARIAAFLKACDSGDADPRLAYFRALVSAAGPGDLRRRLVETQYARAMTFLFEKEFTSRSPVDTAVLYQARGLSTDTAVEAGYAVYAGLGVMKALDSSRRIRRVLIVGPGMDLAPRTGMLEVGPPESYQPWAVIDALVGLRLSRLDDLEVVAADINPRVVEHLRRAPQAPPLLHLVSGIGDGDGVTLAAGYREYFAALGAAVGDAQPAAAPAGHLARTVRVSRDAAAAVQAASLDIVTERFDQRFDLIIATNILPYFDHVSRLLALSNVAAMLAPGGVFLHNDPRPAVMEDAAAADLVGEQLRQVIIASVRGAPPLADTIVLHRRR